jgi:hypothetical protein
MLVNGLCAGVGSRRLRSQRWAVADGAKCPGHWRKADPHLQVAVSILALWCPC